ncbi:MAG: hypothetical protein AB7T10_04070 [bacterium]
MKNMIFVLMILALLFVFGCTPSDSAKNLNEAESQVEQYTPPSDGKITEEQMNRYISTASMMSKELLVISEKVMAFKAKYGMKDETDLENLDKFGPGAKSDFEAIMKEWEQKEANIYKTNNMSPSEFEWVAAGLTDPLNTEIQKKVEKALSGE